MAGSMQQQQSAVKLQIGRTDREDFRILSKSTQTKNKKHVNIFQDVLAQITRDNFFLWKNKDKWCVLAQITINKVQDVLAQITRDIFFLWKDKGK